MSKAAVTIDILGIGILLSSWTFILASYESLPAEIPIHFNASGEADGWGSRNSIFMLPILGTILFFAMRWITTQPHLFNYPVTITEENKQRQHRNAVAMIHALRLIIVAVFAYIDYETIEIANAGETQIGSELLIVITLLIFAPVVYFLVRAYRLR